MIDRQPVGRNQSRSLFHKSLLQIGEDSVCFFVLPNETQEGKKRFLKERRKMLLDQIQVLHGGQSNTSLNGQAAVGTGTGRNA